MYANTRDVAIGGFFRSYHFPVRDKSDEADESGLTDSIWAVVAGVAKALGLRIDYVLNDMSYANLNLYSASLPTYRKAQKDKQQGSINDKQDIIKADDPKNRELVRQFIEES